MMHTGVATPASAKAARASEPARAEIWFVAIALLATMLVPLLGKYQAPDAPESSPLVETIWSIFYLAAGIRLFALRGEARALLARSLPLLAFLGLMLASVLWSVNPTETFKHAGELIGTTLIGYYVVARFSLVELLDILALSFGCAAVLSIALIFGAPGHARMDWGTGAWSGIFQDKNNLGTAMALAGLSLLVLAFVRMGRARLAVLGVLGLAVTLLVGAASATAFCDYAFTSAAILAGWACRSRTFGTAARVVTVAVVVLIALGYFVFGITPDTLFSLLGREPNLTGRTDFWPYLQQAIADRPFLGYGYDAFFRSDVGSGYLSYYIVEAGGWTPYHAHNSFLQLCLDGGFVGLGLFLVVLAGAFRSSLVYAAKETSRAALWPFAVLLFLVLGSFTETYFRSINTIEWVLFVAAVLYPLRGAGAASTAAEDASKIRGRR
jgi:O-antigen ligase